MRPILNSFPQVGRVLICFGVLGLSAAAFPVAAQDAVSTEELQEVVVTGSRIARPEAAAVLPVQVITQDDIQHTGATSVEQLLQTVSVAMQGNSNQVAASGAGANTGGVAGVSLRGLGSQRTLVLINGRRVPGGGTITDSTTVDVNNIPLSAVQRVEVLKDGASAIYGSDAIAGVVNFILNDNYQGAEVSATGGGTSDGGATMRKITGTFGTGDLGSNRYNIMLSGSYQKELPLYGSQRAFTRSSINEGAGNDTTSGNTYPANISAVDDSFGTMNPSAPGNCSPSLLDPNFPPTRCRYDPAPYVSLVPSTERHDIFGSAHFKVTDALQLYLEASYTDKHTRTIIQPVPLSNQFALPSNNPLYGQAPYNGAAAIVITPSSPYYPTAYVQSITGGATPDLNVFYRSYITGNRDWTDISKQPRIVLGGKGDVAGWDYDIGALYSETKLTEHVNNGIPAYSKILPILNSGLVNFWGPTTDPAVLAAIDASQFREDAYSTTTGISSIDASMTRKLFALSGGQAGVAVGAELRKEKFTIDPNPAIVTGDISHYGGNYFALDKSRNVTSVYGEIDLPLLQPLEVDVAVRYDDYQNTGSKTTPKVSFNWKPGEQVHVRGSYGKGFRAPSLTELYQPRQQGVSGNGLSDPVRCPTTGSANDCLTQFNVVLGGNPDLKPEESDNYTLGLVFQPSSNISLVFDAFKVKLKNTIIFGIDPSVILGDLDQFGFLVTRGPTQGALPGQITQIDQTNLNFGTTRFDGIDADLRIAITPTVTATFASTYMHKYEVENLDGTFTDVVNTRTFITNGYGGVIPRWHHYATIEWKSGLWDIVVTQNYQARYRDVASTVSEESRQVGAYLTHDLQLSYMVLPSLKLTAGAKNIFNRDPPYTNAGGQDFFQAGYDPGYADPRGRFIYGTVAYSLKWH